MSALARRPFAEAPEPGIALISTTIQQQPGHQQPPALTLPPFGPQPTMACCPHCHERLATKIEYRSNHNTHLIAILLCHCGCCCSILPYCMDSCRNADHYCSNCGAYLGSYEN